MRSKRLPLGLTKTKHKKFVKQLLIIGLSLFVIFSQLSMSPLMEKAYAQDLTGSVKLLDSVQLYEGKDTTGTVIPESELASPLAPDQAITAQFHWQIPAGVSVQSGDTYTFSIPKQLQVFSPINKPLDDNNQGYGSFSVPQSTEGQDTKVTITFNQNLGPGTDGNIVITSELKANSTDSTQQTLTFPIGDAGVTYTLPIHDPSVTLPPIDKSGTYSSGSITWTVNVNEKEQQLNNAVVTDSINSGLTLDPESVTVKHLGVQIGGGVTPGTDASGDYTNNSTDNNIKINFKNPITSAYQIQYKTTVTDTSQSSFNNRAYLNYDGAPNNSIFSDKDVPVPHGPHIEKKVGSYGYDSSTQTINWIINYNGDLQNLAANTAKITDSFTGSQKYVPNSLQIKNATVDTSGNFTSTGNFLNVDNTVNFSEDGDEHGFNLTFKNPISTPYQITYQTTAVDGDAGHVYGDTDIANTATAEDGKSDSKTQTLSQQNIVKDNPSINYNDKTAKWTIHVNTNKYSMTNTTLTDTFGGGLTLLNDENHTFKVTDERIKQDLNTSDYTLTPTAGGFTISSINSEYASDALTITYYTNFDISALSSGITFTNQADLQWDENSTHHDNSDSSSFDANQLTQDNGFKKGSFDYTNKLFNWNVGINYNKNAYPYGMKIEDPITTNNQTLVTGSVKIYKMGIYNGGSTYQDGSALNSDQLTANNISVDTTTDPSKLIINFDGPTSQPYLVTYQTKDSDGTIVKDAYKNTANVYYNGSSTATDYADNVTVIPDNESQYSSKSGHQDSTNHNLVDWEVHINASQSNVSDAVLEDTGSANQIFDFGSFHLYKAKYDAQGNVTADTNQEVSADSYKLTPGDDKHSFTLAFNTSGDKSINTGYVLEYKSLLYGADDTHYPNNTAVLKGGLTQLQSSGNQSATVKLSNGYGYTGASNASLTVTKRDINSETNTNAPLSGIQFKLYDQTGSYLFDTKTTGDDGTVTFSNLKYGKYILKEVNQPNIYVSNDWSSPNGKVVDVDQPNTLQEVVNYEYVGKAVLTKKDKYSGKTLQGAHFKLQVKSGNDYVDVDDTKYGDLTTGPDGTIIVDGLDPGDYRFVETQAPDLYLADSVNTDFNLPDTQTKAIPVSATDTMKSVSVGDYVWYDKNRNGIQDSGESGINGVQLHLSVVDFTGQTPVETPVTDIYNQPVSTQETQTNNTTQTKGYYEFDNLPALPTGKIYRVTVDSSANSTKIALGDLVPTVAGSENGAKANDSSLDFADTKLPLTGDEQANNDPTLDFGYYDKAVSVGDYVWLDKNRDGIQNDGDTGIPNVTVTLTGPDGKSVTDVKGNPVEDQVTDENGHYEFDDLPAGNHYTVSIIKDQTTKTALNNLIPTAAGAPGSTLENDSSTGFAKSVLLTENNTSDPNLDFGYIENSVSVGDFIWLDKNKDGIQDNNESGIENVVVNVTGPDGKLVTDVYGNEVKATKTDSKGHYEFENLPALPEGKHYTVKIDQDASQDALTNLIPTKEKAGGDAKDSSTWTSESGNLITDGDKDLTLDFGFIQKSVSVGDYVWLDKNKDGIQNDNEKGIEGVTVTIKGPNGQIVKDNDGKEVISTKTDKDGHYEFTNLPSLPAGQHYTLSIDKDASKSALINLAPTKENGTSDKGKDSSTWTSESGNLINDGDEDQSLDFGFIEKSVTVGDYVWVDKDKNGVQDKDESGIPGVVLVITGPDGKPVTDLDGNEVKQVKTDSEGHYEFSNLPSLPAGQHYTVSIDRDASKDALKGLIPAKENGTSDKSKDSSTWKAESGNLINDGDKDLTLDFGFVEESVPLVLKGGEPGAIYNVIDENGHVIARGVMADEEGNVNFKGLATGKYHLVLVRGVEAETQMSKKPKSGLKSESGSGSGSGSKSKGLPITGDTNDIMTMAAGAILLLGGGFLAFFSRRRRKN